MIIYIFLKFEIKHLYLQPIIQIIIFSLFNIIINADINLFHIF